MILKSDFTEGKYFIPASTGISGAIALQECIDKYEPKYIYDLLGVTLGNTVIAYLQGGRSPVNADLDYIIDPFQKQDSGLFCRPIISYGLKELLKACIFYEYQCNSLKNTPAGVVNGKAESADVVSPMDATRFAENKFNGILSTSEAIQMICQLNSTTYSGFQGVRFPVKNSTFFL